jgi:hypothetical protein
MRRKARGWGLGAGGWGLGAGGLRLEVLTELTLGNLPKSRINCTSQHSSTLRNLQVETHCMRLLLLQGKPDPTGISVFAVCNIAETHAMRLYRQARL